MKNKQKYILLLAAYFSIMAITSLYISNKIALILSGILVPVITFLFFKSEICNINYNKLLLSKHTYEQSFYAFTTAIISQTFFNLISMVYFTPVDKIAINIPIVPVYAVMFGGAVEELIFRYIIYGMLQGNKEKFSIVAASISSLLFAIMHFNIYGFIGFFVCGMIFCWYYFKSKNIFVTILAHTYTNFLVILVSSIKLYI